MKNLLDNFLTSGFNFAADKEHVKVRYQTLNIGILLNTIGISFGIIANTIRDINGIIPAEIFMLLINLLLIYSLRKYKNSLDIIVFIMITQFTTFFLFLVYVSEPASMKYLWLYTYPIVLLFLQDGKKSFYWLCIFLIILNIAPFQTFIEVHYTVYQLAYMSFVLTIMSIIMYFYQSKMHEANQKILEQQEQLKKFNDELESEVNDKVQKLRELNELLEMKVEEKLDELRAKDKILEVQSKQAVMGEMISMIAHQWRQPLSTITLRIANLQFQKLLGEDVCDEKMDTALSDISDTIIYLSDTVDDFQTYFRTDKESIEIDIHELLMRAVNFCVSRVKENNIQISVNVENNIKIKTYANEFVQVILNILNNAIDALNEFRNGPPVISVNVTSENKLVYIKISDNAAGITSENLIKLFEPYFSTKGKNGTGLGLYMSQMIVQKQFSGDISVQSSSKGSSFTIKVPKNIS